jgi:hypothetical protein
MPLIRQDGGISRTHVNGHMPSWADLPEGHSDIGRVAGGQGELPDFANPDASITHEGTEGGAATYRYHKSAVASGYTPPGTNTSSGSSTKPSVNSMGRTIIDI